MSREEEPASLDEQVKEKRKKDDHSIRYHIRKEDLKLFWRTFSQAADDLSVIRQQCYDCFESLGVKYIKSEKMSLRASRMSNGKIKTYPFFVTKKKRGT